MHTWLFVALFIISGGMMVVLISAKYLEKKTRMLFFWPEHRGRLDRYILLSMKWVHEKYTQCIKSELFKKIVSLVE